MLTRRRRARELLICVPRSSAGAASALAGPSSSAGPSHAANGTPARAPAASRLFPVHSTPALGSVFLPSSPVSHLGLRSHLAPAGATPSSQIGDDSGRFPSRAPPSPLARSAYYADGDESCASPDPSQQGSAHVHFAPSQETSRLSDVGSEAGLAGHDDDDEDDYQFARAMFEQHHFERCVAWLEKRRMTGARAQFLRLYAKYLVSGGDQGGRAAEPDWRCRSSSGGWTRRAQSCRQPRWRLHSGNARQTACWCY